MEQPFCAICDFAFVLPPPQATDPSEAVTAGTCPHVFHDECLAKARRACEEIGESFKCPICRKSEVPAGSLLASDILTMELNAAVELSRQDAIQRMIQDGVDVRCDSQDEVAAGAAAASTPRAVAPAPSTPASAASALAPAASAADGSSMGGVMGDEQSVAALIQKTDIYCGVCGEVTSRHRARLVQKKQDVSKYKCNACHSKMNLLSKSFGRWPPNDEWSLIPAEQRMAFFRDTDSTMKALGGKARNMLMGFEENVHEYECGGEYKPLKSWGLLGYDEERILRNSKTEDRDYCEVAGDVFRVPVKKKSFTWRRGTRKEDTLHNLPVPAAPAHTAPAARSAPAAAEVPTAPYDSDPETSTDSEDWNSDWSQRTKSKKIEAKEKKRTMKKKAQLKVKDAAKKKKELKATKRAKRAELEVAKEERAAEAAAAKRRKTEEAAAAKRVKATDAAANNAENERRRGVAQAERTAEKDLNRRKQLASKLGSMIRTAKQGIQGILDEPASVNIPEGQLGPARVAQAQLHIWHVAAAAAMNGTNELPFDDLARCKLDIAMGPKKCESLLKQLQSFYAVQ